MSIGLLYDGDGLLLEGDGPDTFTAAQVAATAFLVIIQAEPGNPDSELRLGDRLWVIPQNLDLNSIVGRLVKLAERVCAGCRVGLVSESIDMGQMVHEALLLVLREMEGVG